LLELKNYFKEDNSSKSRVKELWNVLRKLEAVIEDE